VVLTQRLRDALARLNPELPAEAMTAAHMPEFQVEESRQQ